MLIIIHFSNNSDTCNSNELDQHTFESMDTFEFKLITLVTLGQKMILIQEQIKFNRLRENLVKNANDKILTYFIHKEICSFHFFNFFRRLTLLKFYSPPVIRYK